MKKHYLVFVLLIVALLVAGCSQISKSSQDTGSCSLTPTSGDVESCTTK